MTSSVSADFDIDAKEFKEKAPILTKFLDNNDENKLECLHAIYDLTLKINNPPSINYFYSKFVTFSLTLSQFVIISFSFHNRLVKENLHVSQRESSNWQRDVRDVEEQC